MSDPSGRVGSLRIDLRSASTKPSPDLPVPTERMHSADVLMAHVAAAVKFVWRFTGAMRMVKICGSLPLAITILSMVVVVRPALRRATTSRLAALICTVVK